MEKLRIIKYGNPIFADESKKRSINPIIGSELVDDMILTMQVDGGFGLAGAAGSRIPGAGGY